MADKNEIKKNIRFYRKEKEKWEFRITICILLLFIGGLVLLVLGMGFDNQNNSVVPMDIQGYFRFIILSPILIYLRFSFSQHKSSREQLNLYKLKSSNLQMIKENQLIFKELTLNSISEYKNVS